MNKNIRNYIGLLIAAIFVAQIFAMPVYGMEIEKSVDMTDAMPGEDIAYTIRVNFTENASDVTIVDHLPDGLVYINDSQNGTLEGKNITWNLGDVNESIVQILLNVSIAETYNGTAVVNNSANLSYDVNGSTHVLNASSQEVGIKEKPMIAFVSHIPEFLDTVKQASETVDVSVTTCLSSNLPYQNISTHDVIFISTGPPSGAYKEQLEEVVNEAKENGAWVIVSVPTMASLSNVNLTEHSCIMEYWQYGGVENMERLLVYLGVNFCGMDAPIEEPIYIPMEGIYHPDSDVFFENLTSYLEWYGNNTGHQYDPSKPTIGIFCRRVHVVSKGTQLEDALIRSLEEKEINVIAAFSIPYAANVNFTIFYTKDDTPVADAIIDIYLPGPKEELTKLGIPVIMGVVLHRMSPEEWRETNLILRSTSAFVVMREIYGEIEPIVVCGREYNETVGRTEVVPIDSQIDFMANRAASWVKLRHLDNKDKKIAVIYHHHHLSKAGIESQGTVEGYLRLLNAMQERDYTIPETLPNETELRSMMIDQGRNTGEWADDCLNEMVENHNVTLIPEDTYLEWFNELPLDKRNEIIDMWGEPPGELRVYTNETGRYIVIPGIFFGNIFFGPKPAAGIEENETVLLHREKALVPNHAVIAHYFWLKKEFGANAMIRFGEAYLEYYDGKDFGLSADTDWPYILLQDIPHINIYDSAIAKRRANPVLISELPPPIARAELYGNLSSIDKLVSLYDMASGDMIKVQYAKSLLEECIDISLGDDLCIDLTNITVNTIEDTESDSFQDFLYELRGYIRELKNEYMDYGMHTLGEDPSIDLYVPMIELMVGKKFKEDVSLINTSEGITTRLLEEVLLNGSSPADAQNKILGTVSGSITDDLNLSIDYAQRIEACTIEIPRILDALECRFIPPAPAGDPIQNPDVLPTGRNTYPFDPRIVPTEEAWEIGKDLADQLLAQHFNKTGEYPRKVSICLFPGSTIRTHGIMEAEVFYLLGVEPVWDKRKYITDVKLINSSDLGRPRIDVVAFMPGHTRALFEHQIHLINKAVRLAAEANDTQPNYVKENTELMRAWLIKNGYDNATADILSTARVFGPAEGEWNPGLAHEAIGSSGAWDDDSVLIDLFIGRMSHVYVGQESIWGEQYKDLFVESLRGIDLIVGSATSRTASVVNNHHAAEFFGGMRLAVESISGNKPDIYINDLRDPTNPKLETLERFIIRELRATFFSQKWLEGLQEHEYAGAASIDEFMESLWAWEVMCPDIITDYAWNEAYDTFVQDKHGMTTDLFDANPHALQSVTARMLEAIRKGYWDPSDDVKTALAETYQKSVEEYGVTCCHHTCGNPFLDETISGILSVPGAEPPKQSSSSGGGTYPPDVMTTPKPPAPESTTNETQAEDISAIPGGVKDIPVVEEPEEVVGQVIEKTEMKTDITFSGMEVLGLVAVLLVLGLIYAGFRYRKR